MRRAVIGEEIRPIAARVACLNDSEAISEHLKKVMQFGVKVHGGNEYA